MKENVLKALWWAWMLLPIGLACFVLPIPCFAVWGLIKLGDPNALLLLPPTIFSAIAYIFYRYTVQHSGFAALHAAAWTLVISSVTVSSIPLWDTAAEESLLLTILVIAGIPLSLVLVQVLLYYGIRILVKPRS